MALMFEKCEQASSATDFPSPEGVLQDMQAFIVHQEKEKKSLLSGDEDLDNLVCINQMYSINPEQCSHLRKNVHIYAQMPIFT